MKGSMGWLLIAFFATLALLLALFAPPYGPHDGLMRDVGRLYPVHVQEVAHETSIEDLQARVIDAHNRGLKVSIAGRQHSQGGHTYYDGALVLDMKGYNKILDIDTENKRIRVESGASWANVQEAINPHGLAIKVMQSSNIFTVGGSMSANAHGRDLDQTQMIEVVHSFRLLLANGTILNVSREEHPDLFSAVIGGYGMYGVILDVDLQLTDDEMYEKQSVILDYTQFPQYFDEHIKTNESVALMLVRPSIDPKTQLQELVIFLWVHTDEEGSHQLLGEQHVRRDKFFLGLSREFDWGKALRWNLQRRLEGKVGAKDIVSRNNAMRPPTAPILLLDYYSPEDTDVLQEYFIPTRNYLPFMEAFRAAMKEYDVNAISFTIRYVNGGNESMLEHTPEDAFAFIFYSNEKLSPEGRAKYRDLVQHLVDVAIENDGTYYLTYNLNPTPEQLRAAYPRWDEAVALKRVYDPDEVFMSKFYERYALGVPLDALEQPQS